MERLKRYGRNVGIALVSAGWWMLGQSEGVVFTVGLVMLSVGCACYDPPLGLIVPGAIMCGLTTTMHLYAFFRGGS